MAKKIVNTKKISHEEWLELRKRGIGGSDAGAVINRNRWSSPITIYSDKLGLSKPKEPTEPMIFGTDNEPYVAERFTRDTGKKVKNDNCMYCDNEYEFLIADIDRRVVGENAGLECKCMKYIPEDCNLEAGEVPDHYYAQCQHYMSVLGFDRMYLDIYVVMERNYVFTIDRNEAFIAEMRKAEIDFWQNHVMKQIPPEPSGQKDSLETIKDLCSEPVEDKSVYIPGLDAMLAEYKEYSSIVKEFETKRDSIKGKIQMKMDDAEISDGIKYGCTWKRSTRTGIDTERLKREAPDIYKKYCKVTPTRTFRVKTIKAKEK